jgi:hypothetical protein
MAVSDIATHYNPDYYIGMLGKIEGSIGIAVALDCE